VLTRQLQVERRTGKVRRPKTDVLPLWYTTNQHSASRGPSAIVIILSDASVNCSPDLRVLSVCFGINYWVLLAVVRHFYMSVIDRAIDCANHSIYRMWLKQTLLGGAGVDHSSFCCCWFWSSWCLDILRLFHCLLHRQEPDSAIIFVTAR